MKNRYRCAYCLWSSCSGVSSKSFLCGGIICHRIHRAVNQQWIPAIILCQVQDGRTGLLLYLTGQSEIWEASAANSWRKLCSGLWRRAILGTQTGGWFQENNIYSKRKFWPSLSLTPVKSDRILEVHQIEDVINIGDCCHHCSPAYFLHVIKRMVPNMKSLRGHF